MPFKGANIRIILELRTEMRKKTLSSAGEEASCGDRGGEDFSHGDGNPESRDAQSGRQHKEGGDEEEDAPL